MKGHGEKDRGKSFRRTPRSRVLAQAMPGRPRPLEVVNNVDPAAHRSSLPQEGKKLFPCVLMLNFFCLPLDSVRTSYYYYKTKSK